MGEFQGELVDRFVLASAAAGVSDGVLAQGRVVVEEFVGFAGCRVWEVRDRHADRWLVWLRGRGLAKQTVYGRASTVARFYAFLTARYVREIWERTGCQVVQPFDEFNRPRHPGQHTIRVPPSPGEVQALFEGWRGELPGTRKYAPAVRKYVMASLWRRAGLRLTESVMLDVGDWYPDWGGFGKLHVRFGKGSQGRGPKARLVPGIDGTDVLLEWWLAEVRPYFGPDHRDPRAPMFPSERRTAHGRAGLRGPRAALAGATQRFLPVWTGRLTPHVLRHFCASSLYGRGVDLKAIQELLGHEWLATTTGYVHVRAEHIERAWAAANDRVAQRLGLSAGQC
ncbi:tyrosine-type recombinase/integrase [Streptomyces sp. NPDC002952]|uniref:tyrosine-type recombinase/integrase n=1 Tax=Streptomyces sp. NPDC002952 TaxID=3364673 RepID=UPI0036A147FA